MMKIKTVSKTFLAKAVALSLMSTFLALPTFAEGVYSEGGKVLTISDNATYTDGHKTYTKVFEGGSVNADGYGIVIKGNPTIHTMAGAINAIDPSGPVTISNIKGDISGGDFDTSRVYIVKVGPKNDFIHDFTNPQGSAVISSTHNSGNLTGGTFDSKNTGDGHIYELRDYNTAILSAISGKEITANSYNRMDITYVPPTMDSYVNVYSAISQAIGDVHAEHNVIYKHNGGERFRNHRNVTIVEASMVESNGNAYNNYNEAITEDYGDLIGAKTKGLNMKGNYVLNGNIVKFLPGSEPAGEDESRYAGLTAATGEGEGNYSATGNKAISDHGGIESITAVNLTAKRQGSVTIQDSEVTVIGGHNNSSMNVVGAKGVTEDGMAKVTHSLVQVDGVGNPMQFHGIYGSIAKATYDGQAIAGGMGEDTATIVDVKYVTPYLYGGKPSEGDIYGASVETYGSEEYTDGSKVAQGKAQYTKVILGPGATALKTILGIGESKRGEIIVSHNEGIINSAETNEMILGIALSPYGAAHVKDNSLTVKANGDELRIFNGVILGGYAESNGKAEVSSNKITFDSHSVVHNYVIGGFSKQGTVKDNQITIPKGADLTYATLIGYNDTVKEHSGNTLILEKGYTGHVRGIRNFDRIVFEGVKWKEHDTPILTIDPVKVPFEIGHSSIDKVRTVLDNEVLDKTDLTNTDVDITESDATFINDAHPLVKGEEYALIHNDKGIIYEKVTDTTLPTGTLTGVKVKIRRSSDGKDLVLTPLGSDDTTVHPLPDELNPKTPGGDNPSTDTETPGGDKPSTDTGTPGGDKPGTDTGTPGGDKPGTNTGTPSGDKPNNGSTLNPIPVDPDSDVNYITMPNTTLPIATAVSKGQALELVTVKGLSEFGNHIFNHWQLKGGVDTFALVAHDHLKYDMSKEKVSTNTTQVLVGIGKSSISDEHRKTDYALFLETGRTSADVLRNEDKPLYGMMNHRNNYFGIGAQIYTEQDSGFYMEGGIHIGKLHGKHHHLSTVVDTFKTNSQYWAGTITLGKYKTIGDDKKLDLYTQFMYGSVDADDYMVGTSKVHFDTLSSATFKLGARMHYSPSQAMKVYYGIAVANDFGSTVNGHVDGVKMPALKVKGLSYEGEFGLSYDMKSNIYFDLGLRVFGGKRQGASGNIQLSYKF